MARSKDTWYGRIASVGYRSWLRNNRSAPRVAVNVVVDGGSQHDRRIDIILTADEARSWAESLIKAADTADKNAPFLS